MDLFNRKKLKEVQQDFIRKLKDADVAINNYKTANKVLKDDNFKLVSMIEDRNKVITEKEKTILGLRLSLEQSETYIEEQKILFGQTVLEKDNAIDYFRKKYQKTEVSRRKVAGAIGGHVVYANRIKKQLLEATELLKQANNKITWLQRNTRAPSFDEINAYDFQQKEVERRQSAIDKASRLRKEEQLTIDTVKA